jgi:uncharacterized membrane protein
MNYAHLHLMLNHFPVIGTLIGLAIILFGLIRKNDSLIKTGLVTFILMALITIPTFLTGEPSEKLMEKVVGTSEALIERHEEAAKFSLIVMEVLGTISLITMIISNKFQKFYKMMTVTTTLLAFLVIGMMAWTANLGGKIHHLEIQANPNLSNSTEANKQVPTHNQLDYDD